MANRLRQLAPDNRTPENALVLCMEGVNHAYVLRGSLVPVLNDVTIQIARSQTCAIVGPSGSGKSTLLNIFGLLDRPSSGTFSLFGLDVGVANTDELASLRSRAIGFVFQAFNLLPRMTAIDNVALPLRYRGSSMQAARQCAAAQLDCVGLSDRLDHYPADLSGGQRQRVAIARALVGNPKIILADEPTGSLDAESAEQILALLLLLTRAAAATLVTVTHDQKLARAFDRCITVRNGRVSEAMPAQVVAPP